MTTVPTAGDEEAGVLADANYMVGNPSAWDSYDEGASEVIRYLLADRTRLRQERDEAQLNAAIIEGVSNELDIALSASNAEAERLREEWERLGSSATRDRLARKIGCNADLLHDALQQEAARALQGSAKQ